jgi:hypothetical protein
MPTRFMKQMVQLVRGAVAIGMDRRCALRLAIRCARDSMPPLRLAIVEDLTEHPASTPTEVRRRLDKPRATIDRQLQSLHILGVAALDETEREDGKTTWRYSIADGINPNALSSPEMSPPQKGTQTVTRFVSPSPQELRREDDSLRDSYNESGNAEQMFDNPF